MFSQAEMIGLSCPLPAQCQTSGWRSQFAYPRGILGRVTGHIMAFKNAPMNRFAVEVLDVQPQDRVLEIGFGSGKTVHDIAARARDGFVAGIDPSATMVAQATGRNRDGVRAGRVLLVQGTASSLPFEDGRFTKVLAVNSFQFWASPIEDLREVRRVLQDGGRLVLGLRQIRSPGKRQLAPGFTAAQIEAIVEQAQRAGFRAVRTETRQLDFPITCVVAEC